MAGGKLFVEGIPVPGLAGATTPGRGPGVTRGDLPAQGEPGIWPMVIRWVPGAGKNCL
jgi:hypothetical protein